MLISVALCSMLIATVHCDFLSDCAAQSGKIVGTSCFTATQAPDTAIYSTAKTSCNKIANTYGHLAFIRSMEQISELLNSGVILMGYKYKVGILNVNGVWSFADGNDYVQGPANLSLIANPTSPCPSADFSAPADSSAPLWAQDTNSTIICEYEQHSYYSCIASENAATVAYDWCFYWQGIGRNLSFSEAENLCQPYGHLAALVTQEIFDAVQQTMIASSLDNAWVSAQQNFGAATKDGEWYWKILQQSTTYVEHSIDLNQIQWAYGRPDDHPSPVEAGYQNYGILNPNNGGLDDQSFNSDYTVTAAICQYKAYARVFTLSSLTGYYNGSEFLVAQKVTRSRGTCTTYCSLSEFCLSFAYNSATQDCQLYAITPENSAATNALVSDSNYELRIRVGITK